MTEVTIYTRMFCGPCARAVALLQDKGAAVTEIAIDGSAELHDQMHSRSGGRVSVPQIFIGAHHVGGWTELSDLERAGKLDALLKGEG